MTVTPAEQDHDCAETCACGEIHLHGRTTVFTNSNSEEHSKHICGRLNEVDQLLRQRLKEFEDDSDDA